MPSSLTGVVINEFLPDPNGASFNFDTDGNGTADSSDEFVEFYNNGGSAVDISGWELWGSNGGLLFTFPATTTLEAGARAVVVIGVQTGGSLPSVTGDDLAFDAGRSGGILINGGGNIYLYDPNTDFYVQAIYNGAATVDPTTITGFSGTATISGSVEDFGSDVDGRSVQRDTDGSDTFVAGNPSPGSANCFAAGTGIATPDGEARVEDLKTGDLISTEDGRTAPVKWLGRQTLNKLRHGPHMQPVRIRAGALSGGLPHSDLTVTADHGMVLDGYVINASALVNGGTIDFAPLAELEDSFTVYHVETEAHDVILANGAPAETFIDAAGRAAFDNHQEYLDLYGAERIIPEMAMPRISTSRLLPEAIRRRLNRAQPSASQQVSRRA